MDSLHTVHERSPEEIKPVMKKKKQVKVVYISNPMRFKASASEFKSLVQQFTGQDSDIAELSRFAGAGADHYSDDPSPGASTGRASFSTDDDSVALSRPGAGAAPTQQLQNQPEPYKCEGVAPFDAFDDVFTQQVLENLAAFMPTASLYYEPPPPDV